MSKELLLWHTIALVIGYGLDLILGDPVYSFHPIRLIGLLIGKVEQGVRRIFSRKKERLAGFFLFVLVVSVATLIPGLILYGAYHSSYWLGIAIESIFCYQLLATKALKQESMKVYTSLVNHNLEEARYHVSMIVGRDTKVLDEEGVTKAAVETIAENASDGVIAPLLYMMLGGATLGFFYKAVNTLDSMVGYKNDKYINLGRVSAKMDDALNYIPSRIAGAFMVVGSFMVGLDAKNAWYIFRRDSRNHASPNSAQTEAACAGALNVRLAGDAYYFGTRYEKPFIGDANRNIEYEDIKRTNRLLYATSLFTVVVVVAVKVIVIAIAFV